MTRRYFGTDGIRGRVGEYPISADFMLKLGWAAGRVLAHDERRSVVIGKDTRVSGYMFESALEAGLCAAGMDIRLLGPMPTPAIAYLTRTLKACAGIVISASHNPYEDNGIKFFSASGEKLPDEVELEIEALLDEAFQSVTPDRLGKAERIDDAPGRYIEFCKGCFPRQLSLNGLKLVLDCANGATYHVAPRVFSELGADVHALSVRPDGFNINLDSGSTATGRLRNTVTDQSADAGIAFDGDGDRAILIDHQGNEVNGDAMLYIIAAHAKAQGRFTGGVVGTVMSNLGLENALKALGIEFRRAQVGDRYVNQLLNELDWELGGETSGHILSRNFSTTGDGIVTALQVLAVMVATKRRLSDLSAELHVYPQRMINVPVNGSGCALDDPAIKASVRDAESALNGKGRVILRASGTQPLVRVTVEGEDRALVDKLAEDLSKTVAHSMGEN